MFFSYKDYDSYAQHYRDTCTRLKNYAQANGIDQHEIENYFMTQANPFNMKGSYEATVGFIELVEQFLKDENYD